MKMRSQLYLFTFSFALLMQHVTYGVQAKLYYAPHYSYGAFYAKTDEKISTASQIGLFSGHLQISPRIGISIVNYDFFEYKEGIDVYEGAGFYGVGKYSPSRLKKRLFSRKLQGYGQVGGWFARVRQEEQHNVSSYSMLKGKGLIVGLGAQYAILSRVLVDASWKQLIYLPLLEDNTSTPIEGAQQFNIGLMLQVI